MRKIFKYPMINLLVFAFVLLSALIIGLNARSRVSPTAPDQQEPQIEESEYDIFASEPEVKTSASSYYVDGEYDVERLFADRGWNQFQHTDDYGRYEIDSIYGYHASLYLGWESSRLTIYDVGNYASVRLSTDSVWDHLCVKDTDDEEAIPAAFAMAINAVLERIDELRFDEIEKVAASCVEIDVLTYDEAEALFPASPAVRVGAYRWYDKETNAFDVRAFFAHYGFAENRDEPHDEGFGVYGVKAAAGDAYACLMLDPKASMFQVENVGDVRVVQCICESATDSAWSSQLGEDIPKELIVAANAVFDRITDPQYAGELERALEELEVEGVSFNVLSYDEAEEVPVVEAPETQYTIRFRETCYG